MPSYFKKELPEQPVYIFGRATRFDLLETEDQAMINELRNCVANHTGGIVEITKEEYQEEVKKKELEKASKLNSTQRQWRPELSALNRPGVNAAVAGELAKPQQPQIGMGEQFVTNRPTPEPLKVPEPTEFVVPKPKTAQAHKKPPAKK